MNTTGVLPEALAASISRRSRSEIEDISNSLNRWKRNLDPIDPTVPLARACCVSFAQGSPIPRDGCSARPKASRSAPMTPHQPRARPGRHLQTDQACTQVRALRHRCNVGRASIPTNEEFIMQTKRFTRLASTFATLSALAVTFTGAITGHSDQSVAAAATTSQTPTVTTADGKARGVPVHGGDAFRGLPYAAPPTGDLRWRPPQPPAKWAGIRDASQFAPSPIQPSPTPFTPAGPQSEDSLYLNVSTPQLGSHSGTSRPVLVWFHGGGMTLGGGRYYDATRLAAHGGVVVTVNYRLGVFGFLADPALATRPGGPTGNYGLMDQQAALRWVRDNIRQFGGDPNRVTIAGQSSGGLDVLAHLVSPGSRGLFDRAIVQSGAFALHQQSLAEGEAAGV